MPFRPMPWKCPACQSALRHDEEMPHPGSVYRCHVCRLEFIADLATQRLVLAPLPTPEPDPAPEPRR
jgi:rubredoxin